MATALDTDQTQHMQALGRANRVRLAQAVLKHEVHDGTLSIAEAMVDRERLAHVFTISNLLACQRQWGNRRADRLCFALGVTPSRPVLDLTERQRTLIVAALP